MITEKMFHNANKVAFLVKQYPEHTLTDIIGMLQMPSIEINTAIWAATNMEFITEVDEDTQRVELGGKTPGDYEFGNDVDELMGMLEFTFNQLAKKEQDLEENYISNWTMGYPAHDVIIALAHLVNTKVLATYELTDPKDTKSTYTFYTAYENGEQMWGRKQFKEEPVGDETPDEDDTTTITEPEQA